MTTERDLKNQMIYAREEGREEGELRLSSLLQKLLADSRSDDLARALSDTEYRETLYKKYNIN